MYSDQFQLCFVWKKQPKKVMVINRPVVFVALTEILRIEDQPTLGKVV